MDNATRIQARYERSMRVKKVATITPFPISNSVFGEDVRGSIIRYLFPCSGVITKGIIKLDLKPKKSVIVTLKLSNDSGSITKDFTLETKSIEVSPKVDIQSGDKLEVLIASDEPIKEAWIAFLWLPSIKNLGKELLLEEPSDEGI